MIDYFEWSNEYKNTANNIADVIDRLKSEKEVNRIFQKRTRCKNRKIQNLLQ